MDEGVSGGGNDWAPADWPRRRTLPCALFDLVGDALRPWVDDQPPPGLVIGDLRIAERVARRVSVLPSSS